MTTAAATIAIPQQQQQQQTSSSAATSPAASISQQHDQKPQPQAGPPHYVDLHVNAGECVSLQLLDGQEQIIAGPATITMISQQQNPPVPIPVQVPPGHMIHQIADENGTLKHIVLSVMDASVNATNSTQINLPQGSFRIGSNGELINTTNNNNSTKGLTHPEAPTLISSPDGSPAMPTATTTTAASITNSVDSSVTLVGDPNQQTYYANYDGCPVVPSYDATIGAETGDIVGQVILDSSYAPATPKSLPNSEQPQTAAETTTTTTIESQSQAKQQENSNNKLNSDQNARVTIGQQHGNNDNENISNETHDNVVCSNTIQNHSISSASAPLATATSNYESPKDKQSDTSNDQTNNDSQTSLNTALYPAATTSADLQQLNDTGALQGQMLTSVDGQLYGYAPPCGCCCCYCDPTQTELAMNGQPIQGAQPDMMLMPPPQPQDHLVDGSQSQQHSRGSSRSARTSSVGGMMAPYSNSMGMPSMAMQQAAASHHHSASPVPLVSHMMGAHGPMMGLMAPQPQLGDASGGQVGPNHMMPTTTGGKPHGKGGRGGNGGYKQHHRSGDRGAQGGYSYNNHQTYNNIVAGGHHGYHQQHHDQAAASGYKSPAYSNYHGGNHVPTATMASVVSQGVNKQQHNHNHRGIESENYQLNKQQQQQRRDNQHYHNNYYNQQQLNSGYSGALSSGSGGSNIRSQLQQHNNEIKSNRQITDTNNKNSRHSSVNSTKASNNSNNNNSNLLATISTQSQQQVAVSPIRSHNNRSMKTQQQTQQSTTHHNQHHLHHNNNLIRAQNHQPPSHNQNIQQQPGSESNNNLATASAQSSEIGSNFHLHGSRPTPAIKSTYSNITTTATSTDDHQSSPSQVSMQPQHIKDTNTTTTHTSGESPAKAGTPSGIKTDNINIPKSDEFRSSKQQQPTSSDSAATGESERSSRGKQKRQQQQQQQMNNKQQASVDIEFKQKGGITCNTSSSLAQTTGKKSYVAEHRLSESSSSSARDQQSPVVVVLASNKSIKKRESSLGNSNEQLDSFDDSSSSRGLDSNSSPTSSNKSSPSLANSNKPPAKTISSDKSIDCDQVIPMSKTKQPDCSSNKSPSRSGDSSAQSSESPARGKNKTNKSSVEAKQQKEVDGDDDYEYKDEVLTVKQQVTESGQPAKINVTVAKLKDYQPVVAMTMRTSFSENNIQSLEKSRGSILNQHKSNDIKLVSDSTTTKQQQLQQQNQRSSNKRRGSSAKNEHHQYQQLKPNSVSQVKLLNLYCTSATPTSVQLRWSYNPTLAEECGIQQPLKGHHHHQLLDHFVVESSCIKNSDDNSLVSPKVVHRGCTMTCKVNHLSADKIYHFKVRRTALVSLISDPTSGEQVAVSEIVSVTLPAAQQQTSTLSSNHHQQQQQGKKLLSASSSSSSVHGKGQTSSHNNHINNQTGNHNNNGNKAQVSHNQVKLSTLMRQCRTRFFSILWRLIQRSLSRCGDTKFAGLLSILFAVLVMLLAVLMHVYFVAPLNTEL